MAHDPGDNTPESLEAAWLEIAAEHVESEAGDRVYRIARRIFYGGACAYGAIFSERHPGRPRDAGLDGEVDAFVRDMSSGRVRFKPRARS